ncbi:MAG TPA: hypothetical protein VMF07_10785 [Solirubrobacteraceae bacterium]|nr:hypothetical protein [Solirubrobacteraceae bacterium]
MRSGIVRWTARGRFDAEALAVVGAAIILANLPALLGLVHLDPLAYRAGLTRSFTPGLLGGRPTIDPSNGFNSQAIGHLAVFDLLHLHLPWWNPFEGTGMPLVGETQAAALFPPTLLTALPNGQLYEHVLLELTAGVCTYRLLRRLDLVRPAAVAGAVAFALNGKFAWFSDATVNPIAFLPMLLLGIEQAVEATRAGRRGGWRLIALAGALTAYAGFPEVAYADLLIAVVWLGWRIACVARADRARFLVKVARGGAVALLLAAPMLLAMADYLSHADLVSHTGTLLGGRHLPLSEAPQLLMPYIFGPVNGGHHQGIWVMVGGYLSTALVLLAVIALLSPGRRGLKLVLLASSALVFGHMYGVPVLGSVLGALPEMGRIQFYRYATAALELPVIVLAALGIDDLTRGARQPGRLMGGTLVTAVAIAAAAVASGPVIASFQKPVPARDAFLEASVVWAGLTVLAVGGFALLRHRRARSTALALVVVLDAVVLFAVPQLSAPRAVRTDLAPVTYLRRHLGDQRFFTLGPIQPNYGSYFRLASLRLDDFPPRSYARFVHDRLDPFTNFVGYQPGWAPPARQELLRHLDGYRAAGVRYVLTRPGHPLPEDRGALRLVFRSPTAWIYRLSRAAPLVSAPGCALRSVALDDMRLYCRRPTTLIRRETWFAGWGAELDGHAVAIHRFDGVFQAVRLPAGVDDVSFHFVPVGMRWAILGLLAGCVLMVSPTTWRLLTLAPQVRRLGAPAPTAV